jgi:D-amino-acid dehydrogenase
MPWMTPHSRTASADVAVVGGGVIGACIALDLARRGASVALLERGAELAWGCSAGNAGIVGASHVLPLADPTAVRDGIRWMTRADSPFFVRPRPRVLPWLVRFTAAATPRRVDRHRAVLHELASESAALHAAFDAAGLDAGYRRRGLLNVYCSERAFAAARAEVTRAGRNGGHSRVVTGDLPNVLASTLTAPIAGAILEPDEAHCDPRRFVRAIGNLAAEEGVDLRTSVEVLSLRRRGRRIHSLWTTSGDLVVNEVVLAAGVWSGGLARALGLRLPLEGGKGYHVDVESRPGDPELPIWLHESRVVITPLEGRLRLAGTLELTGTDRGVDARRVDAIIAAVRHAMPHFGSRRTIDVWRGLRPCTPDGLPVIGRAPDLDNAILATGHGMWGLQLAPVTARLVAAIVSGERAGHDLHPLRPDRFQLRASYPGKLSVGMKRAVKQVAA